MAQIPGQSALAAEMASFAESVRVGIEKYAVVRNPDYGTTYAYELDNYGGHGLMDDANIPSLLSIPLIGYKPASDPVYEATRKYVLSTNNPYYMIGSVLNA
jgi:meiotically up-regulated gene 157 (Mug157) protein